MRPVRQLGQPTSKRVAALGNQIWQSNGSYGEDSDQLGGREAQLGSTGPYGKDGLDKPDGPPEPVAQVRVLPGALRVVAGEGLFVSIRPETLAIQEGNQAPSATLVEAKELPWLPFHDGQVQGGDQPRRSCHRLNEGRPAAPHHIEDLYAALIDGR